MFCALFGFPQLLSRLETRPHDTLALKFISDFLYGKPAQLPEYLKESTRLTALKEKDSKFWVDLIKRYLGHPPAYDHRAATASADD
jgi:hypothetical protein